jgi:hypothetical protein
MPCVMPRQATSKLHWNPFDEISPIAIIVPLSLTIRENLRQPFATGTATLCLYEVTNSIGYSTGECFPQSNRRPTIAFTIR